MNKIKSIYNPVPYSLFSMYIYIRVQVIYTASDSLLLIHSSFDLLLFLYPSIVSLFPYGKTWTNIIFLLNRKTLFILILLKQFC